MPSATAKGPDRGSDTGSLTALGAVAALTAAAGPNRRARLSVGVINNMPDQALDATARQFSSLLSHTAQHFDLRIQMFSLPTIPRYGHARGRVQEYYIDFGRLQSMHMDALIVTGAPPAADELTHEPFWPQFASLVDWARTHTLSTLFSCLSAHAAVLHLDGIRRSRLPRKLSGVFDVDTRSDDPLLTGLPQSFAMPHSRYNTVDEADLRRAGYQVLTRSEATGADIFTKDTPSLFVFCQGHPEYDADTLAREYRRDVAQFREGLRSVYPDLPVNYFAPEFELRIRSSLSAHHETPAPSIVPGPEGGIVGEARWAQYSRQLFRNWVEQVLTLKAARLTADMARAI